MSKFSRHHPSWRAPERRALRPELWLLGALIVAVLLIEVWQTSQVAAVSLELDQTHKAFVVADAQLGHLRAEYERGTTRAELAPQAKKLGLARADAQQVRALPVEYLASESSQQDAMTDPVLALAKGVSRALVPEARARGRAGN